MTPTLTDLQRLIEVIKTLERKAKSLPSEQTRFLWPDLVDLHVSVRQILDREEEDGLHRALKETIFAKR